ncbi:MAG: hypothetical protein D6785_15585 [Planctomycetota bacterium]|nr:MAG: hypothetical protein D6785_15585 [Planctomycetota bacterium]
MSFKLTTLLFHNLFNNIKYFGEFVKDFFIFFINLFVQRGRNIVLIVLVWNSLKKIVQYVLFQLRKNPKSENMLEIPTYFTTLLAAKKVFLLKTKDL